MQITAGLLYSGSACVLKKMRLANLCAGCQRLHTCHQQEAWHPDVLLLHLPHIFRTISVCGPKQHLVAGRSSNWGLCSLLAVHCKCMGQWNHTAHGGHDSHGSVGSDVSVGHSAECSFCGQPNNGAGNSSGVLCPHCSCILGRRWEQAAAYGNSAARHGGFSPKWHHHHQICRYAPHPGSGPVQSCLIAQLAILLGKHFHPRCSALWHCYWAMMTALLRKCLQKQQATYVDMTPCMR